ncbi:MAG TPA: dihydroneopterin aldolase [Rhizorhapis sp.]
MNGGANGLGDYLVLEVDDLDVDVLTGIYSEETHLPQPLRISVRATLEMADHYAPGTPLSQSKNYMDLKHAASAALPQGQHFTLIEAVAEHIIETVFLQDRKVRHVEVKIVKLALSERGESIGITMGRARR